MTYSKNFKQQAVKSLAQLKELGIITVNNQEIKNVRELVKMLGISSKTLYGWVKVIDWELEEEYGEDLETVDIKIQEIVDSPVENFNFGMRFWGFVAKNMKIRNYSKMSLNQLKISIGKSLIGEN